MLPAMMQVVKVAEYILYIQQERFPSIVWCNIFSNIGASIIYRRNGAPIFLKKVDVIWY